MNTAGWLANTVPDPKRLAARSGPAAALLAETLSGDGLLHDARNLISAIGLYCDLLSVAGVLKPEHLKYPDELRLLGIRSQEMIEHLMQSLVDRRRDPTGREWAVKQPMPVDGPAPGQGALPARPSSYRTATTTLRSVVERCSGLLSRVSNGRRIEVIYGPAAEVPIRVAEESVERILVNLVRNGSAASGQAVSPIRIHVGPLDRVVGERQAWPFERVRLVVEDSGCGMVLRQLDGLLSGRDPTAQGNHGIGFCVVRELVAASQGELRAVSAPGIGTRIQIEWPIAAFVANGRGNSGMISERTPGTEQNTAASRAIAQTSAGAGLGEKGSTAKGQGAH